MMSAVFQVSASRTDIEEAEERRAQNRPEDGLFDMVTICILIGGFTFLLSYGSYNRRPLSFLR